MFRWEVSTTTQTDKGQKDISVAPLEIPAVTMELVRKLIIPSNNFLNTQQLERMLTTARFSVEREKTFRVDSRGNPTQDPTEALLILTLQYARGQDLTVQATVQTPRGAESVVRRTTPKTSKLIQARNARPETEAPIQVRGGRVEGRRRG